MATEKGGQTAKPATTHKATAKVTKSVGIERPVAKPSRRSEKPAASDKANAYLLKALRASYWADK